jgi:hypothetical protein
LRSTEAISALNAAGFVDIPGILEAGIYADGAMDRSRAGSRNLLDLPWCQDLAATLRAHADIAPLLPPGAVAVQCTLFDKSADRNWLVALHQDLSIPVQERAPHPECTGWSEKEGVVYVQPPVRVLESLVAVRVHLDRCGPDNGPLRVVPRSHRHGRLSTDAANALRQQYGVVECFAQGGDVLVMRPLLLHSSSKALAPGRRRVLHVLFGPPDLPCGLRWHRAV